jgi:phosphatidylserine synthase
LRDFQGFPTTGAGSFLALLIYLDYQSNGKFLPLWIIPLVAIFLALLMVSDIRFMSKKGYKKLTVVSLIATVILGIFVSLPLAGLIFLGTHILHGLLRALWMWIKAGRMRRALKVKHSLRWEL